MATTSVNKELTRFCNSNRFVKRWRVRERKRRTFGKRIFMPSPALDTHPEIQLLLRPLGFTLIPDPHLSSATAAAADTERKHGRRSSRVCSTGGDDDGPPLQVIMHHHQPAPLMAGPLVLVLLNTPTTQYVHPSSRPTNRCRSSPVVVVIIQNNHIVQIVIKPEEKTSNTAISRRLDRFSFFARVMFSFKPPITRPTERLLSKPMSFSCTARLDLVCAKVSLLSRLVSFKRMNITYWMYFHEVGHSREDQSSHHYALPAERKGKSRLCSATNAINI